MGLVMLSNHASGHWSSMSRPMPASTGMLRSARLIPPGPMLSPTDWWMPWRAGTSMSTAMLVKPPVEMVTTTKSAPSRARRWFVVVDTVDLAPSLSSAMRAMASIFSSGTGSMSSRTRWTPASDGRLNEIGR